MKSDEQRKWKDMTVAMMPDEKKLMESLKCLVRSGDQQSLTNSWILSTVIPV